MSSCSLLRYTIGFGNLLPRKVGDAALISMRSNEKARAARFAILQSEL